MQSHFYIVVTCYCIDQSDQMSHPSHCERQAYLIILFLCPSSRAANKSEMYIGLLHPQNSLFPFIFCKKE